MLKGRSFQGLKRRNCRRAIDSETVAVSMLFLEQVTIFVGKRDSLYWRQARLQARAEITKITSIESMPVTRQDSLRTEPCRTLMSGSFAIKVAA